jgi:hypothetical protein
MPVKGRTRSLGTGQLRVLQKLNPYEFGVELWLMRDGPNDNHWNYQNLEKYYLTFVGRPILIAYVMGKIGDGHNSRVKIDFRTGEEYQSYTDGTAERIVGTLSDDKNDFSLRERDGHTWIVAKGKLFAFYAKETVDEIVRTGRMDVSVETMTDEEHQDGEITVFDVWEGLGVTILGAGVAPAIPGANIARLAAMNDEFKALKLRAASLQKAQDSNDPNFGKKTQKGVRNLDIFNKRQLATLSARFEGYTVLSAAKNKDGKIFVCLMAKDGGFKSYVMENEAETIAPERLQSMTVNAAMKFGDEECAEMDVQDFMECVNGETRTRMTEAEDKVATLESKLEQANNQLNAMQEFENKRRLNAAKAKATEVLARFNASRAEKVAESAISAILGDIDGGLYTNSVDKDGNWIGEKQVSDAVYAVCGKAVEEMDAAAAQKNRKVFSWDKFQTNEKHDDGSVSGLLASWGIDAQ